MGKEIILVAQALPIPDKDSTKAVLDAGVYGLCFILVVALVFIFYKMLEIMRGTNEVIVSCTKSIDKNTDRLEAMGKTCEETKERVEEVQKMFYSRPCIVAKPPME